MLLSRTIILGAMTMEDQVFKQVNDFFDTYAQALENNDTKLLAYHYYIPCTLISDDNLSTFNESSKLEGLFNQGVGFYKQFGIVHAVPAIWSKDIWTDKVIRVKVNWQYYDAQLQPIYNCDYQYILKSGRNNKLKIVCSVSVNEKLRMNEWLQQKKSNIE